MDPKELDTYRDLKNFLNQLTDEQLDQRVQVATYDAVTQYDKDGKPLPLELAISIASVKDLGFNAVRSDVDNKYHAEEIVILTDTNSWAEDGSYAQELTGPGYIELKPIYSKDGPTSPSDQRKS